MDPVTTAAALKVLGKAFSMGLAVYKVRQSWGVNPEELSAVESLVSGAAGLVGMISTESGGASTRLLALHTALITRAFATACREHWAGNKKMAPGVEKQSWIRRRFLPKEDLDRQADIESRLRMALDSLGEPTEGGPAKGFERVSGLVDHPLTSPYYGALWKAFTDPLLDAGEQARLLELDDRGARLEFERLFRLAYAEAIAAPVSAELARGILEMEMDRPRLLREIIVRWISTWKSRHVFGDAETAGVPNMPLGEIYVEPFGSLAKEGVENKPPLREPIRKLIQTSLKDHKIIIVRGDFGQGKSLTARTLACEWAETYVTVQETRSSDLWYPIFIKCGEDFLNHQPALGSIVCRAFQRHARALKIDLSVEDDALANPTGGDRVLYLIDGFDEVALTPSEVDEFFKNLDQHMSATRRAIVFSRKGALPQPEKLRKIPVLDLEHLQTEGAQPGGQVAEWLERWNRLTGRAPITIEELEKRRLLEIAKTPILLFMAALTWDECRTDGAPVTRAEIYERFFRQIAMGKCRQDEDEHKPVAKASEKLLEQLVETGVLEKRRPNVPEREERAEAMLWMLARVAWEAQRCAESRDDLTLHEVTSILKDELKIRNEPSALEMIKIGVLLVLQSDQQGGNDRILFGHKSFREFLVARYWADRLKKAVVDRREMRRSALDKLEKQLLGARLLGEDDESLVFLMELINGPEWDNEARAQLTAWASETFNREAPDFADQDAPSWLSDRRPALREAALAIGSLTIGSSGITMASRSTLRTMLGSFWIRQLRPQILAPRMSAGGAYLEEAAFAEANLSGADLEKANLFRATFTRANLRQTNFAGAALMGAFMFGANAEWANFKGAFLQSAQLVAAGFQGANFESADLENANLQSANLQSACLLNANLQAATLARAYLEGANLEEANLEEANLAGANLAGANLAGANLAGANLLGAGFADAAYDARTRWPEGFNPEDAGASRLSGREGGRAAGVRDHDAGEDVGSEHPNPVSTA